MIYNSQTERISIYECAALSSVFIINSDGSIHYRNLMHWLIIRDEGDISYYPISVSYELIIFHAKTMLAWESKSVHNISNSLLPTVSRSIASTSAILLVINLWMHSFGSVLGFHSRFSSKLRSTFSKDIFVESSYPYYWVFPRIITNLGVNAFTWVVSEVSDDAEALATQFLEFGTSFLRRHHMRTDSFFCPPLFQFLYSSQQCWK